MQINGSTGIVFPGGGIMSDPNELAFFYWGDITMDSDGVRIARGRFSGSEGVYHPLNKMADYAKPSQVKGSSFASTTGSTEWQLPVPAGTTEFDTIYIMTLYDNSSTERPFPTGFTIVRERNGSFAGAAQTTIVYKGSISPGQTSITIPNSVALGGGLAAAIVVYGRQEIVDEPFFYNTPDAGSTTTTATFARNVTDTTIILGTSDGAGAETVSVWNMDSNYSYVATGIPPAVDTGIAGMVAAIYNDVPADTITLYDNDLNGTSGTSYTIFTSRRVA